MKAAPGFRPAALGLTTQGETLVPVDAAGRPLRPCLVWLDGRAQAQAETLARELDGQRFYETTGLPQMDGALPLAKALWLAQNEPDVLARAHKLLLLEDYFLWKLTGRFATEPSLQTSTGWYDIRRDGYWPQALALAGLRADQLPELLACGQRAGGLTAEAARFLGLPQGLPVVAGAMDQTAAALAAGSDRPGAVTETTGTALVMTACTDAPVFPRQRRVTVYRHALPGSISICPSAKPPAWRCAGFGTRSARICRREATASPRWTRRSPRFPWAARASRSCPFWPARRTRTHAPERGVSFMARACPPRGRILPAA